MHRQAAVSSDTYTSNNKPFTKISNLRPPFRLFSHPFLALSSSHFSNPNSDRNSLPPWQPRTARWMVLLLARSSLNLTSAGFARMLSTT